MNKTPIIEKINKLRELSRNSAASIEEAASAARIAEKLIQEHQLAEAELELSHGSQESVLEDEKAITDWNQRQTVWQNILITNLCKAYNCTGVLKFKGNKLGYYVIGRFSDISIVRYQYAYFVLELSRLAHVLAPSTLARGSGKHWHKSFYLGAVNAITKELKEVKENIRTQTSSSALVVIDKHMQQAIDYRNQHYPNSKTADYSSSSINQDAYRLGQQAGSNLKVKPALTSNIKLLNK